MATRVIVTRPQREAERWVGQLQSLGIDAEALPLIAIAQAPDPAAVADAWHRLDRYDAVMFVSANAVEHFFGAKPAGAVWHCKAGASAPRAWATGAGTAQALRDAGMAAAQIDAPDPSAPQFDSEALWDVVHPSLPVNAHVLIVRGADTQGRSAGRPWLSDRLVDAGAVVDLVAVYTRAAPVWTAIQQQRAAEAAGDGSVWLFSSSEAVRHLRQALPQQPWQQARAVATHPRIAQAAQDAGFGVVYVSRPGQADVVASIESFR